MTPHSPEDPCASCSLSLPLGLHQLSLFCPMMSRSLRTPGKSKTAGLAIGLLTTSLHGGKKKKMKKKKAAELTLLQGTCSKDNGPLPVTVPSTTHTHGPCRPNRTTRCHLLTRSMRDCSGHSGFQGICLTSLKEYTKHEHRKEESEAFPGPGAHEKHHGNV